MTTRRLHQATHALAGELGSLPEPRQTILYLLVTEVVADVSATVDFDGIPAVIPIARCYGGLPEVDDVVPVHDNDGELCMLRGGGGAGTGGTRLLGHQYRTNDSAHYTVQTEVPNLDVTVTVPAGAQLQVSVFPRITGVTAAPDGEVGIVRIKEDGATIQSVHIHCERPGQAYGGLVAAVITDPTPGLHTYSTTFDVANGTEVYCSASETTRAWITVEDLVGRGPKGDPGIPGGTGVTGTKVLWRDPAVLWRDPAVLYRQGGQLYWASAEDLAAVLFQAALYTNEQAAATLFNAALYTNTKTAETLYNAALYTNDQAAVTLLNAALYTNQMVSWDRTRIVYDATNLLLNPHVLTQPDADSEYTPSIVAGRYRVTASAGGDANHRIIHGFGNAGELGDSEVRSTWHDTSIDLNDDPLWQPGHAHRVTYDRVARAARAATGGGASTLTDSTRTWTTDEFAGGAPSGETAWFVTITAGTGVGQTRRILSNTATQLTVTAAWATAPVSGSTYEVWSQHVRAITWTAGVSFGAHYQINCHVWDGSAYTPLGYVIISPYLGSPGGPYEQFPWHVKSRVVGNVTEVAVWLPGDPEPEYGTPGRSGRVVLPDGWMRPGESGLYIGHIPASGWMEFADISVTGRSGDGERDARMQTVNASDFPDGEVVIDPDLGSLVWLIVDTDCQIMGPVRGDPELPGLNDDLAFLVSQDGVGHGAFFRTFANEFIDPPAIDSTAGSTTTATFKWMGLGWQCMDGSGGGGGSVEGGSYAVDFSMFGPLSDVVSPNKDFRLSGTVVKLTGRLTEPGTTDTIIVPYVDDVTPIAIFVIPAGEVYHEAALSQLVSDTQYANLHVTAGDGAESLTFSMEVNIPSPNSGPVGPVGPPGATGADGAGTVLPSGLTIWGHSWACELDSSVNLAPVVTPHATARERTWPQLIRNLLGLTDSVKVAQTQYIAATTHQRFPFYTAKGYGVIGWARYTPSVEITGNTGGGSYTPTNPQYSRIFSILNMTDRVGNQFFFGGYTHRHLLQGGQSWNTKINRDYLGHETQYIENATFPTILGGITVGFSMESRRVRPGSVVTFESRAHNSGMIEYGGTVECVVGEEFQNNAVSGSVLSRARADWGGWSAIDFFYPGYGGRAAPLGLDIDGKWIDSPLGNLQVLMTGQNDLATVFGQSDWKEALRFAISKLSCFMVVNDAAYDPATLASGEAMWVKNPAITYHDGTGPGVWSLVAARISNHTGGTVVGAEWTHEGTYTRWTGGAVGADKPYIQFQTGAAYTGSPLAICFVAKPGAAGGTGTLTVDTLSPAAGGYTVNGGTSDQVVTTGVGTASGAYPGGNLGIPIVKRIEGLTPGNHVVKVTIDSMDVSGQFIFNWFGMEAHNPPKPIIVCNQPVNATPTAYPVHNTNPANVATFNGWTNAVASEFPAGQVVIADIFTATGGNTPDRTLYNPDGVHLNDEGHVVLARAVRDAIMSIDPDWLVYR